MWLTQSPVQLVLLYFSGGKWPEGIVDHTPPSMRSAEVKNEMRYNVPFPIYLHGMDWGQMYLFSFKSVLGIVTRYGLGLSVEKRHICFLKYPEFCCGPPILLSSVY
jgi:hypothetical protein